MDNTIYQTSDIYRQFADNFSKRQRNFSSTNKINTSSASSKPSFEDNKKNTNIKAAAFKSRFVKITTLASVAAISFCFINNYKKGIKAIELKDEVLENINSADDFKTFIKAKPYSLEERNYFAKVYTDYLKYSNNYVGKIHNALTAFSEFMKRNFYNY